MFSLSIYLLEDSKGSATIIILRETSLTNQTFLRQGPLDQVQCSILIHDIQLAKSSLLSKHLLLTVLNEEEIHLQKEKLLYSLESVSQFSFRSLRVR